MTGWLRARGFTCGCKFPIQWVKQLEIVISLRNEFAAACQLVLSHKDGGERKKKIQVTYLTTNFILGGGKSKQTEIAVYSACGKLNTMAPCSHKDWATNWEISPTLNC